MSRDDTFSSVSWIIREYSRISESKGYFWFNLHNFNTLGHRFNPFNPLLHLLFQDVITTFKKNITRESGEKSHNTKKKVFKEKGVSDFSEFFFFVQKHGKIFQLHGFQ